MKSWLSWTALPVLLVVNYACTPSAPSPEAVAAVPPPQPVPLVVVTWVPGPCSPNGQPHGQSPPGDLFRERLVPIAEGLRSPRDIAFTPNGELLITEIGRASCRERV